MSTTTSTPTRPGSALRMLRQRAGVKQSDLASWLGISPDLLRDVETGEQQPPSSQWIGWIADALAKVISGELPAPGIELDDNAVATLQAAGVDPRWWKAERAADNCGCTDDRCIGFHHDVGEPCGCLPVLIRMEIESRTVSAHDQTGTTLNVERNPS